jgi:hypothetical protein
MTADSMMYVLRPAHGYREARRLGRGKGTRVVVIRPNWSMPAPAWNAADPGFWRAAPVSRKLR